MIEVSEFPDLAQRFQVYGVPLTVINDSLRFEGGAPEVHFVPALMSKLGITAPASETHRDESTGPNT